MADRPWTCSISPTSCSPASCPIESHHPFASSGQLAEVQPGLAFVDAFANSAAVDTDDGLVVVDTSGVFHAKAVHETIRTLVAAPARHRDLHARPHRPRVRRRPLRGRGAHERLGAAARRSRTSAIADALRALPADRGLQRGDQPAAVQGAGPALADRVPLSRRDVPRHADDRRSAARRSSCSTTAARPTTRRGCGRRRARCCSRATCSSGRRPTAATRRRCSATRATGRSRSARWPRSTPEVLLPGHGLPIVGADRVHQALTEGAELLESLVEQTLALMNEGARLDDIVHTVRAPAASARTPVPARRSTTSPSSSCATSGGCTAAGTTAIRRT